MAQVFGVTGASLAAKYSNSGKTAAPIASLAGNTPTVAASGLSGLLSAGVIKMDNGSGLALGNLQYVGKNNTPARAFSVLLRCSFGQNTGLIGLWGWGSADKGEFNRVCLYYNGGTFTLRYFDVNAVSRLTLNLIFTPVVNTLYDILAYSDGLTTANGAGININNGAASATGTLSAARPADDRENVIMLSLGSAANDVSNTRIVVDEFDIRDTVIASNAWPLVSGSGALAGASRSSPSLMSAFDAQSYSYPSASDIRSTAAGLINAGVAVTPTLVVPTLANTKTGVAGDGGTGTYDGSDRWTDPGVANVRSATAYKANSTSNNRTGTASIPTAANVRSGTATDATTGSLAVPVAGDVRSGSAVDNTTGTLVVPSLANTKTGVAGDGGTGTYDGSDRHTDPGVANVRSGTAYKSNSTSNNRTGTQVANLAADVKHGVASDGGTGTYQGDDVNDVVLAAQLKHGVSILNRNVTVVGTYRAADLYDVVTAAQLKIGITKNQDGSSVVGEYAGDDQNEAVAPTDLKHGVEVLNLGGTVTGSYRGDDLWDAVAPANLELGVSVLQDGSDVTGLLKPSVVLTVRAALNQILVFIGAATLTDDEFEALEVDEFTPAADIYTALFGVLTDRETVSSVGDRLRSYFEAKGVVVGDEPELPDAADSNILIGDVLTDEPVPASDEKSNIFLGGEL